LFLSRQGVGNYRLDILASDVKGAVAALGHSSCTLVAHDWGGGVAWVTAGMYGSELIDRLIVIGLPHLGISSTNMNNAQYVRSLYMLTFQVGGNGVLLIGWVGLPGRVCGRRMITDQGYGQLAPRF
jgi:pimeloyl-ACP methyl ester carboxylesterase